MVTISKRFAMGNGPPDRINQMRSDSFNMGSNNGSSTILRAAHAKRSPSPSRAAAAVGKYSPIRNPNTGNNIAEVRSSILSCGSTPQERFQNMQKTNNGRVGGGYSSHTEDFGRTHSFNSLDAETMNTDLFKKFEDAFNITLGNNPDILPGAPAVIESIKSTMFKVQKINAAKEVEMRKQLDEVKAEMSKIELQISQQMGEIAWKKSEYLKEMDTMEATKKDLKQKIDEATTDKEEMVKHLSFLTKSRMEIEKALQEEVKAVEKDQHTLQKLAKERKKIQKVKEDNKSLEEEVDRMREEASKENLALLQRKEELNQALLQRKEELNQALLQMEEDLKRLAEKNETLRNENEAKKKELEMEQHELFEITKAIQVKRKTLQESREAAQKQINELEIELARAGLSSSYQQGGNVRRQVASYMTNCGGGINQIVDDVVHPFEFRSEDLVDGTHLRARSELETRQEEEELVEVASQSRSLSRSKARRSKRSKSSKRKQEETMKKEIDGLRIELEAVRARNNIAMQEQEARDAETALRAEIRINQRNILMSSPSQYGHRNRDLQKDRGRVTSPAWRSNRLEDDDDRPGRRSSSNRKSSSPIATSRRDRERVTSPSWRRNRLEDDDDRPSRRNSPSIKFSSPIATSRRSSPYSDRVIRSGGEHRSRHWE
ncbi:hypothetical protein ACHAXM_005462 [Skeletonema potamos]